MAIAIINGPNLNLQGRREPGIYGTETFEQFLNRLADRFPDRRFLYFQSNSEGALVSAVHRYGFDPEIEGIIINPGAYAHYSYALADAIRAVSVKTIEVHISNIFAREDFRSNSVTAPACSGVVSGFGLDGYILAASAISAKDTE